MINRLDFDFKKISYLVQLREEIDILLSQKCYCSAVNNAMILLDSMTKSNNFPYAKNTESDRFVHFCDDCLKSENQIGLTGAELYSIRNFMFHEGCFNINTKKTKLKEVNFRITDGIIHTSRITSISNDETIASIDVLIFVPLITEYFDKYKSNLNLDEINFLF